MTRVVELINRTNQFNTSAARTSLAELTNVKDQNVLLIADVRDKFGAMGIVGAIVIKPGGRPLISHFVLSCRVFGFGIEDAMLNCVRRGFGRATVIEAVLVETPANGPCRHVYKRNGYRNVGGLWVSEQPSQQADPIWLQIDDKTTFPGLKVSTVCLDRLITDTVNNPAAPIRSP
jgi:predicted enzyme involved in methoxymalonyl-ACP biosynthesis